LLIFWIIILEYWLPSSVPNWTLPEAEPWRARPRTKVSWCCVSNCHGAVVPSSKPALVSRGSSTVVVVVALSATVVEASVLRASVAAVSLSVTVSLSVIAVLVSTEVEDPVLVLDVKPAEAVSVADVVMALVDDGLQGLALATEAKAAKAATINLFETILR